MSLVPYVVLLKIRKDYIVIQVLGSIRSEKVCRGSKGARVQWVEHKTFTHNISMSFLCKARISFVLFVLSLFTCLSDGRGLDEGGGAAGSQISAFNFRTTPKLRKAKSKPSYLSSCNQQMFKFSHYASKVSVIHTHSYPSDLSGPRHHDGIGDCGGQSDQWGNVDWAAGPLGLDTVFGWRKITLEMRSEYH